MAQVGIPQQSMRVVVRDHKGYPEPQSEACIQHCSMDCLWEDGPRGWN